MSSQNKPIVCFSNNRGDEQFNLFLFKVIAKGIPCMVDIGRLTTLSQDNAPRLKNVTNYGACFCRDSTEKVVFSTTKRGGPW
jgi:hypothetical protein